jgi:hypothetical protein
MFQFLKGFLDLLDILRRRAGFELETDHVPQLAGRFRG